MAEYADAFPTETIRSLARGIADVREGRVAPLDIEEDGFEADPYQQTIETENFILTFTGPLSDVVTQLQRRALLA
jgi:hypothetical protein